jgi:hypothetical protein
MVAQLFQLYPCEKKELGIQRLDPRLFCHLPALWADKGPLQDN